MNKNIFFEKVGKLTFSILLTGIIVSTAVYGATTWKSLSDGDVVNGSDWSDMVAAIDSKISFVDLPDLSSFYTKTESDAAFTTSAEVIESVMNTCKICISQGDRHLSGNFSTRDSNRTYSCANFGNTGRLNLLGDVNSDDQLAFKIECGVPGIWGASTNSTYTGTCGSRRTTNNEKTGYCLKSGPSNVYYAGETSCMQEIIRGGMSEPMLVPGYDYSTKKTQTCN